MGEYTAYEIRPCENPRGWTTVGRTRRGHQQGTFVPHHHWSHHELAQLHANLLNRGISIDEARATVTALCTRPVEGDDDA